MDVLVGGWGFSDAVPEITPIRGTETKSAKIKSILGNVACRAAKEIAVAPAVDSVVPFACQLPSAIEFGAPVVGEYSKPDKMPSLALAMKQSLLTPFWVTIRKP